MNLARRIILIGGTRYAGEIKKSVFTVMNYLMPLRNVLSMHCSANVGQAGDVAIFFGLSGTGKTTLSSDPHRPLSATTSTAGRPTACSTSRADATRRCIKLREEAEPEIWAASHRFGTVLENVVIDPQTRELDLDDASLTENTRSAYPVNFVPNFVKSGMAGHPTNDRDAHRRRVRRAAADREAHAGAGDVSLPLRLHREGRRHRARRARHRRDVLDVLRRAVHGAPSDGYAKLLGERIAQHEVDCWLVNTGWTGGGYGVGSRMKIAYTRAMVNAAIEGRLSGVAFEREPFFGLAIPSEVPDVPTDVLNPRNAWSDKAAYDAQAKHLAGLFAENFKRFEAHASPDVLAVAIRP